jgi:uncharacterized protein (UPF0335 family)
MGMAKKKRIVEAEPKIGHNGGPMTEERKKQLNGYVSEIERWEREKAVITADIGEIYNAAKDANFDVKAIRNVVKERKIEKAKREAFEAVCDVYKHALGMLADLPLGQAAMPKPAQVDLEEAIASTH